MNKFDENRQNEFAVEDDIENYHCGNCIHWKLGAGGKHLPCKRLDHETIKFATPWFKSYDAGQHSGCICSDFYPHPSNTYAVKHWTTFEDYWNKYVDQWLPYKNTNTLIYFCLNDDRSIRYGVPLMDYVNGTMIDGDMLKAVQKTYYKQSRKSPIGYELVHESINGIKIKGE